MLISYWSSDVCSSYLASERTGGGRVAWTAMTSRQSRMGCSPCSPEPSSLVGNINRSGRIRQDHVRCLFSEHHCRSISIGRRNDGHDRCIHHSQAFQAMHSQTTVEIGSASCRERVCQSG